MLEPFYPDYYVSSAYVIPYRQLYEKGIRGVIFDVDNTLVPHDQPADDRAKKLFGEFHRMGMETCLLSNNKEPRVASFAGCVGSKYIYKGGKPSVKFVGDQLFTDVFGANRAGICSYLVKPIHPKEEIQIVLERYPERAVLYFYKRSKSRA